MKTDLFNEKFRILRNSICSHYFQTPFFHLSTDQQMFIINYWSDFISKDIKLSIDAFDKKYRLRMRLVQP